jgi:hypothetical protein
MDVLFGQKTFERYLQSLGIIRTKQRNPRLVAWQILKTQQKILRPIFLQMAEFVLRRLQTGFAFRANLLFDAMVDDKKGHHHERDHARDKRHQDFCAETNYVHGKKHGKSGLRQVFDVVYEVNLDFAVCRHGDFALIGGQPPGAGKRHGGEQHGKSDDIQADHACASSN